MSEQDSKKVGSSWKVPFVEHKVTEEYRDYLKEKRKGKRGKAIDAPDAPFGRRLGYDPESQQQKALPIEGPPNWNQIWTDWSEVGTDYKTLSSDDIKDYFEDNAEENEIEFKELLGTGGYGEVFRVEFNIPIPAPKEEETPKPAKRRRKESKPKTTYRREEYAAKVIKLTNAKNKDLTQTVNAMLEDIYHLQHIQHKNIVGIKDWMSMADKNTGFPFSSVVIFMELCKGDLFEIMEKAPRNVLHKQYSLKWFKDIVEAVNYLHERHIVHLDIKPENVLYKYNTPGLSKQTFTIDHIMDMTFKLCDFGLSISYNEEDKPFLTKESPGTELYRSIEMEYKRDSELVETKPCDIYSLGMTLACSTLGDCFDDNIEKIHPLIELGLNGIGVFNAVDKSLSNLIWIMTHTLPKDRPTIQEVQQMCKNL